MRIPGRNYYGDYPQIENGVGLVRNCSEEWKKVRKQFHPRSSGKNCLVLTSVSAFPFLEKIIREAGERQSRSIRLVPVVNHYMGETVTVCRFIVCKGCYKDRKGG